MDARHLSLIRLRDMVRELYDARYAGAEASRIVRAQGLADGYMRALSDLGIARDSELLELIENAKRQVAAKHATRVADTLRAARARTETAANLA